MLCSLIAAVGFASLSMAAAIPVQKRGCTGGIITPEGDCIFLNPLVKDCPEHTTQRVFEGQIYCLIIDPVRPDCGEGGVLVKVDENTLECIYPNPLQPSN